MVKGIIDTRIRASRQFHDVLQGFRAGRGTGTAIMGMNITQELASVDHEALFLVFLDLKSSSPALPYGRRTHPPLCGTFQTVSAGGIPKGELGDLSVD